MTYKKVSSIGPVLG